MVMLITEEIRRLRMAKAYSQDYMAEKLGISQQAYSKIENQVSEASLNRLQQIALILEVPLSQLLGLTDIEQSDEVTPSERKVYHEIIVNQQKIIEKQEETIRTISASLVMLQTTRPYRES